MLPYAGIDLLSTCSWLSCYMFTSVHSLFSTSLTRLYTWKWNTWHLVLRQRTLISNFWLANVGPNSALSANKIQECRCHRSYGFGFVGTAAICELSFFLSLFHAMSLHQRRQCDCVGHCRCHYFLSEFFTVFYRATLCYSGVFAVVMSSYRARFWDGDFFPPIVTVP